LCEFTIIYFNSPIFVSFAFTTSPILTFI
jgi:hypothetical protein